MPGSPPSSVTEPGDEAAAEHPVELADAGGHRVAVFGLDVADAGGTGPARTPATGASTAPDTSTSSTRVFQSPQPEHCPDHLGCEVPHSLHTWTNLARLDAMAPS